jgi:hypothetical protein
MHSQGHDLTINGTSAVQGGNLTYVPVGRRAAVFQAEREPALSEAEGDLAWRPPSHTRPPTLALPAFDTRK